MSQESISYSRNLMVCIATLILLYAYMMVLNPIGNKNPNTTVFFLHALPALLCFYFAYKNNYRSFIWINYISMMLFCIAAANVFVGYGWPIYAEVLLTSVMFTLSLVAAMGYKKRAKAMAQQD